MPGLLCQNTIGENRVAASPLLEVVLRDFRFAIRLLRKKVGFALTAVAIFALSIGASAAIFAFVDAALVKPLSYRDPSRLVALFERIPVGDRYHLSYPDYLDWKRLNRVLSSLDVYRPELLTLHTAAGGVEVPGARVSDGFFRTLGAEPFLGRDFQPGEDQPGAQQTVILSYGAWQKRFAADKDVLGKSVIFDDVPYTVVGVLPSGFHFAPLASAEFWITTHGFCADSRTCHPYYGVGRLKPGVSLAAAHADLSSIAQRIAAEYPQTNRDRSATVMPLTDAILGGIRPTLLALLSCAGLLSLIGLVNISSLLLVRSEGRRREMALRSTLGASRARLLFQFAVEGFSLAALGCGIGLLLTGGLLRILPTLIPRDVLENMPYLQGVHFNVHLLFFVITLSLLGGTLFTAGPALQLLLSDMQEALVEGGRAVAGRSWRKTGSGLVVFELAITVLLLVSAGLLTKSFYRLLHEDFGMAADHLALLHVARTGTDTDTEAANLALQQRIRSQMSALPGVISAGISKDLAVSSGENFAVLFRHFRVFGRSYPGEGDEAITQVVSVGYFETLRARLVQGRYFTEADDASHRRVAIINRTLARQSFPGEDPLGSRLIDEYDKDHPLEIIGVVDDVKEGPLDMKATAAVYKPFNQNPTGDFYVTVRTSQFDQNVFHSMAGVVHRIDPGLIADGQDSMMDRISNSQAAYLHRSAAWIIACFAIMALLLGTIGLYGVISYSVGQRTREIGVRMALGAQRVAVYRLILLEAGWLVVFGIGGGILCSVAATGFLRSMLFGVSPWDTGTLVSVACVLAVSALLASYLPAHRAASTDPVEALRAE
jgi:macrolide transport system ATP-binding/permease protein